MALHALSGLSSLITYPFTSHAPSPSFPSLQASTILSLPLPSLPASDSPRSRTVLHILASLNHHPSLSGLESALREYDKLGKAGEEAEGEEQKELEWTLVRRLVVRTWEECVLRLLSEAEEDQQRAEWWGRAERVGGGAGWYLLQTLPIRLYTLSRTLFSQPSPLTSLLHPLTHLPTRAHSPSPAHLSPLISHLFLLPALPTPTPTHALLNPLRLARIECKAHREALEGTRDEWAEKVGKVVDIWGPYNSRGTLMGGANLPAVVAALNDALRGTYTPPPTLYTPSSYTLHLLTILRELGSSSALHKQRTAAHLPPSALTRLWPRLVLLPPIAYFALRAAYVSREQIVQAVKDARETVEGFVRSWVIDPLKDILRTVRTGEGDLHVVSKEGLKSDMDSLERMVVQLASDKLHYTPEQQTALAESVRAGDLTPVLRLYESDIRTPLRSAVGGTLVRSLLIQVQKTKVDVDLALSGIDRLLRSQELTFAFVGVAPSLAVCYGVWTWVSGLMNAGRGRGRYGGVRRREEAWLALRRTELLLLPTHPPTALTRGLLLLSLHTLRTYAQECLPARSRLREGFLEDVGELERPGRGREERLGVVGRMRADWGGRLGWGRAE